MAVTNASTGSSTAGSFDWAMAQFPGQPIYVIPTVEAVQTRTEPLVISRSNVTLDFRFSPGIGFAFVQNRLELNGDNIVLLNVRHYGNDTSNLNDSDCIRIGPRDSSNLASTVVAGPYYLRGNTFAHGRDENLSTAPRANGQATGLKVRGITLERNLIGRPVNPDHPFGIFFGDGTEDVTCIDEIWFNFSNRYPYPRDYAERIEVLNCFMSGNFNSLISTGGDGDGATMNYINVLAQGGPEAVQGSGVHNLNEESGNVFISGFVMIDNEAGTWDPNQPLNRGTASFATTAQFAGTIDYTTLVPATTLKTRLFSEVLVGARTHNGGLNPVDQALMDDAKYGDTAPAPSGVSYSGLNGQAVAPGPVPTLSGNVYPAANAAKVPTAYLDNYPGDTDPAAIIADGSAWNGYMVAERIGAWLVKAR